MPPSIAQAIAAASRTYLLVGDGLVLRCRRPSDEDIRALGGDVLRGAITGQQALAQAGAAREREWSALTPEEREARAATRAERELSAAATQLDQDPEHRARADGLWRAYLCASIEAGALVDGLSCDAVALVDEPDASALRAPWEPLALVPRRELADPEASRVYIGDLLSWPQRMIAHLLLAAREATPPLVAAFRGASGDAGVAGPTSEEVRHEAE